MQNEYTNIKEEPNHCSTGEKVARGMLLKRDEQTLWRHFMRLGSGGGLDEESAPDERTRRDLTTVSQSVSQSVHASDTDGRRLAESTRTTTRPRLRPCFDQNTGGRRRKAPPRPFEPGLRGCAGFTTVQRKLVLNQNSISVSSMSQNVPKG